MVLFITYYSGHGFQTLVVFFAMCTQTFFTLGYVYEQEKYLTFAGALSGLLNNILYFFWNCLIAILILYVTELHKTLGDYSKMNEKLLDGMHEGLLIVSKRTSQTLFCNQPATSLLKGAMTYYRSIVQSGSKENWDDLQSLPSIQDYLLAPVFNPKKVKDAELKMPRKFVKLMTEQSTEGTPFSLDEIIKVQIDESGQKNCIYNFSTVKSSVNLLKTNKLYNRDDSS